MSKNKHTQKTIKTVWISPVKPFNEKMRRPGYDAPNKSGEYGIKLQNKWKQSQKTLTPKGAKAILNKEVISIES